MESKTKKEILEVEVITSEEASQEENKVDFIDPRVDINRTWAALGYIFFLIPLIADFDSKFNRFHANQSILLLIYLAIVNAFFIIPWIGWLMGIMGWILGICLFIFGVFTAYNGKTWRLPIIGEYNIIDSN